MWQRKYNFQAQVQVQVGEGLTSQMDLGRVGMTKVWSKKVRTSRWTSIRTMRGTIGGASGSTSGSLKFSDGLRKS